MKISIITICYNNEKDIRATIESVVGQTYPEIEYIIKDGGSKDSTLAIAEEYQEKYGNVEGKFRGGFKVISCKDKGIYDALNKGVRMARGEWIHVLGCDDWICDPAALGEIVKAAEGSGAEIVVTPAEKDGGGRTINLKSCLYSIPYCHQGVLMKKSLIERLGGFDDTLRLAGDYDLTLRAHLSGAKEIVVPKTFAHYTTGGASSDWGKLARETIEVARRRFGLSEKESEKFGRTRCLPLRILLPLLFHRRGMVRKGAVWQLVRVMANLV